MAGRLECCKGHRCLESHFNFRPCLFPPFYSQRRKCIHVAKSVENTGDGVGGKGEVFPKSMEVMGIYCCYILRWVAHVWMSAVIV